MKILEEKNIFAKPKEKIQSKDSVIILEISGSYIKKG